MEWKKPKKLIAPEAVISVIQLILSVLLKYKSLIILDRMELTKRQKTYYGRLEQEKSYAKNYYADNKEALDKHAIDYYYKNKEVISIRRKQARQLRKAKLEVLNV